MGGIIDLLAGRRHLHIYLQVTILIVLFSGVFQCVREMNNDYEDVYVDGGLLCNYPIHAFDGMYLI